MQYLTAHKYRYSNIWKHKSVLPSYIRCFSDVVAAAYGSAVFGTTVLLLHHISCNKIELGLGLHP